MHGAMYDFTRIAHIVRENAEREAEERLNKVNDSYREFNNYYIPNRIFLTKSICSKIDIITKEYRDKGWDFSLVRHIKREDHLTIDSYRAEFQKAKDISKAVETEMPLLIEELEAEFRLILGVDNS